MDTQYPHIETLALHAGYSPDETNSRAVPLHRTSAYVFNSTEHAAKLFALKEKGNTYSRTTNPTVHILEQRVAQLEGGASATCFSSGTAAIFNTIVTIASQGDNIISSQSLYGGTYTMFNNLFPEQGIHTHFVDAHQLSHIEKAIDKRTKAIFIESIGNPALDILDISSIADLAHAHGIPLIVDSTFTTPYLLKAIDYGADLVINSLTKWYGGHGNALGGIVIDSGTFPWKDNPRFPLLNNPDASYHGLRWTYDFNELSHIAFSLRLRGVPLKNYGACLSPDNAWIFLSGIETLALRMERHCSNALKVAEFLAQHPEVEWVQYPGLKNDSAHALAQKYLINGFGGMVVFGLKKGYAAATHFINNISLFSHLANVGDTRSLAIHPASTTHSQLTEEEQKKGGITPNFIRLSIGIEHIDDILEDLTQALQSS